MSAAFYYLHENGDLIYKNPQFINEEDFIESPFVKTYWFLDTTRRETVWEFLIEAYGYASKNRIYDLCSKWGIDDKDAIYYIKYLNNISNKKFRYEFGESNMLEFDNIILKGNSYLHMLNSICHSIKYKIEKPRINTFHNLLKAQ